MLENINSPDDLKSLSNKELVNLSEEIREFLLENISKTGGHLSSNLGIVELTVALHKVFDSPNDKLIFDVGHQGYVHKILTGRKDDFTTLRQFKGLSGFLKSSESVHDVFDAGHSSTSISAALGYAKAFKLKNMDNKSIAIIGDGSLTAGISFEALNYIGHSNDNVIVILNDNEMSISKNVGAVSMYLSKLRTTKEYSHFKIKFSKFMRKIPIIGKPLLILLESIKNFIKQFFIKGKLFESLGFKYIGVIDGHNIDKLVDVFEHVKHVEGPILIHVSTVKGKGYEFAEDYPDLYHGVSPFDLSKGVVKKESKKYQDVLGDTLITLASRYDNVVAITAAMPSGTGLNKFKDIFPEKCIDVGIAEQNAVTMAGGLSKEGIKPYIAIYSTFLQRAYDQILHDICIQKLDVVFCIDRAGLVGEDGETHHGIFDIGYLSTIPNIRVFAPKDKNEMEKMLIDSYDQKGPIAIRYPRGNYDLINDEPLNNYNYEVLSDGEDIIIICVGTMIKIGLEVVSLLKNEGINAKLINPKQIIPIKEGLKKLLTYDKIVVIEDHVEVNGYGFYLQNHTESKLLKIALPHKFIEHGSVYDLYNEYNLDSESIKNTIMQKWSFNG